MTIGNLEESTTQRIRDLFRASPERDFTSADIRLRLGLPDARLVMPALNHMRHTDEITARRIHGQRELLYRFKRVNDPTLPFPGGPTALAFTNMVRVAIRQRLADGEAVMVKKTAKLMIPSLSADGDWVSAVLARTTLSKRMPGRARRAFTNR